MKQQTDLGGMIATDSLNALQWAAEKAAALKAQLERMDVFQSVFREYVADQRRSRAPVKRKAREKKGAERPPQGVRRGNPLRWKAAREARRYVSEAGRPLPVDALLERFHADGARFGLRNEAEALNGLLLQMPDAIVLLPQGFWLADAQWIEPETPPDEAEEEPKEEPEPDDPNAPSLGLLPAPLPPMPGRLTVVPPAPMLALVANPQPLRPFDFDEHFGALDDNCTCDLCAEWRFRRDRMNALFPASDGHERSCHCDGCVNFRQSHQAFLDVSNRRDLWTEISYHAATNKHLKPYSEQIRTALVDVLNNDKTKGSWWAIRGGQFSIGYWMGVIQNAVTGVAIALRAAASGEIRYISQGQMVA